MVSKALFLAAVNGMIVAIEKVLLHLKVSMHKLAYLLHVHVTEASAEVTVSCTNVLSRTAARQ